MPTAKGLHVTDRRPQPPVAGAVLRAPVPAAPPSAPAAGEAPPTAAPVPSAAPASAPLAGDSAKRAAASAPLLQGRRVGTQSAAATANAEADATETPIAKRRAAARKLAQERDQQAAAAQARKPEAAPIERRRVIEPPVEIRQRRWGLVHPGQVIAAEAAVVGAAVSLRSPLSVLIPIAIASLLVLAVCFVRIDGRWLYEWVGTGLRYLARSRSTALTASTPGSEIASAVSHGGALKRIEVDGAPVAVLTDSTGFTAILEVVPDQPDAVGGGRELPSLSEMLPHNEPGEVPVSVQVVTHTVPAPSIAAVDDAAANSYRELSGGTVPARRRTWICVQAMHSPEVLSASTMEKALINAVRRVERRVRKQGFRPRLRNVRETAADLLMLIRVDAAALGNGVALRESWGTWSAGSVRHVTYRVSEWPALAHRERAAALVDGLEALAATALTTSIAGRRTGEHVDVEAVIRFTVDSDSAVDGVDHGLSEALRGSGAAMRRLDGAHRFGVGATLPTGGFAV